MADTKNSLMGMSPGLGIASTVTGGITDIFGLYMQYYAVNKQIEESRRVEGIETERYNRTQVFNEKLGLGGLALNKRQQLFTEKESELARKERGEQRNYDRVQQFKNGLIDSINSNIAYRTRLINSWRM